MTTPPPFPLRLVGPGGAGAAHPDCPAGVRDLLARDPDGLLARTAVVKRSRRTLVARTVEGDGPPLAVKRYLCGALRWRAGWGRARRAALRLAHLQAAGVPVPIPLAWLEGPHGGFVVCPWLEGWQGADHALATSEVPQRHAATRALADCIGRLHRAGYAHRDLKAANLLCHAAQVALVDVDGARRMPFARPERRARDLQRLWRSVARLAPGRSDCRRFLAAYGVALGDPVAAERVGRCLVVESGP